MPNLQDVPKGENKTHSFVGAAFFVLLAVASFVFTYAYFSNTARGQAASQEAAAAAAPDPFQSASIEAKSAYVVDLTNGRLLFSLNSDAQLPLASLTKVPLVLAVAQSLPLDATITIPYDTSPKGSAMRLGKGEKWTVQDVITFTLVASSNEGANILAQAADSAIRTRHLQAPENAAALWRMNDLAQELGLSHTYFLNVNGLDVSTTQAGAYGSARDYATLLGYVASTSPAVFAGTARDGLLLTDESGQTTSAFNTNEALGAIPGLILGKTGYTDLAGGNLAVVFDVGLAHPVAAVVLGSSKEGRFSDMKILVEKTREALTQ